MKEKFEREPERIRVGSLVRFRDRISTSDLKALEGILDKDGAYRVLAKKNIIGSKMEILWLAPLDMPEGDVERFQVGMEMEQARYSRVVPIVASLLVRVPHIH